MNDNGNHEITLLLRGWESDQTQVAVRLVPLVYDELKRLASMRLRNERQGHTLQTVDLVHEAYLRPVDQRQVECNDRQHFFAIATQAMRRVLVDYARKRAATKRISSAVQVPLELTPKPGFAFNTDILALDQALEQLAELGLRQAMVVELRAFSGLPLEETGKMLGISVPSVGREGRTAKHWLRRQMQTNAYQDGADGE